MDKDKSVIELAHNILNSPHRDRSSESSLLARELINAVRREDELLAQMAKALTSIQTKGIERKRGRLPDDDPGLILHLALNGRVRSHSGALHKSGGSRNRNRLLDNMVNRTGASRHYPVTQIPPTKPRWN